MNSKKILGFALLGLLVVAGIVYYFMGKKGGSAEQKVAAKPGLGPADDAAFQQMVALFKSEADPEAISWLMDSVAEDMSGTNPVPLDPDYLINGQVSKSGAFIGEYARQYYGFDYKFKVSKDDFNAKIYAIFNAFKANYLVQNL